MCSTILWWSKGPGWTSVGKHKVTAGMRACRFQHHVGRLKPMLIPNCLSHIQLIASDFSQHASRQCSNWGMKQRQELVLLYWLRLGQKDRWALSSALDLQSSCRLYKPIQISTLLLPPRSFEFVVMRTRTVFIGCFTILCKAASHLNSVIIVSNLNCHGSNYTVNSVCASGVWRLKADERDIRFPPLHISRNRKESFECSWWFT